MKKIKKIPVERQIALILKDLDESRLRQMKQVIIRAIILINKCEENSFSMNLKNNSMMN